ncbi:MAG: hypothetical protein OEY94_01740 [Alphaproteobacteria bacterium]|nr:hypothetical protein [Alphaproteobacteria bacterium]
MSDTEERKKKKKTSALGGVFLLFLVFGGLVFLPTSMILCIGMLPSIVALLTSSIVTRSRVSTIAALNFVGCVPFVFELWSLGNDFETSFEIITEPLTIIIIYGTAALGYIFDWVVVGVVSAYLYQRSEARLKAINKRQEQLVEAWGEKVKGKFQTKKSQN